MSKFKVLFKVSGSIAAYKACEVISQLVKADCEVQVITTPQTHNFVGAATLEGLTGRSVLSDMFAPGWAMSHIDLAKWADVAVLCPASANTINKMASGLADDLVTALFLAWEFHKPYVLAPAMNAKMLAHPATQNSLQRLGEWGVTILPTEEGSLACGEEGLGRLLSPDQIFKRVLSLRSRAFGPRVLITSGATREHLDPIRFLSNISTGKTGAKLADALSSLGCEVTYLHGINSAVPLQAAKYVQFNSFQDLNEKLFKFLSESEYAAVIHAAAVSDFSLAPESYSEKKLPSEQALALTLKPNFKIVDKLVEYSRNSKIKVVAFKLTAFANSHEQKQAVERLFAKGLVHGVVHNELSDYGSHHKFHFFPKAQAEGLECNDVKALAAALHQHLQNKEGEL